jgi:hypothetical protein
MSAVVQAYLKPSEARKTNLDPQGLYLGLACISLCMFAIALSLKFPSIAEAVALLS